MTTATTLLPAISRHAFLDPTGVAGAGIVLCDLDGCLMSEGRAFADAADFVATCGARLWIVSNQSDSTAADLSLRLADHGLTVPANRILLAGEVTLTHLIRTQNIRRLKLFAAEPLHRMAQVAGVDLAPAQADAVLICRHASVNVDTMGTILAQVADGAALWAANEDMSHPGHDGRPVAETGALLAALQAIRPGLEWQSLGKPHPAMLTLALEQAGLGPRDAVFVGDNARTDGRAAAAAGIRFMHIQRSPEA
ncbi:HAD hydrolase-like protein [Chachezhania sediminis]|uniref:HAD hydrolase-like protein n=1 Tax=Chachezhania sediminis TaxID=2599291 RepID=UPI00131C2F77|nr:HAD hydrolase-like protein [Chachezhania sediminis]